MRMRLRIYSPIRPLNFSLHLSFTPCSSHTWPGHKLAASLSVSAISTRPITQNKRIQVRTRTPQPAVRSCTLLLTHGNVSKCSKMQQRVARASGSLGLSLPQGVACQIGWKIYCVHSSHTLSDTGARSTIKYPINLRSFLFFTIV